MSIVEVLIFFIIDALFLQALETAETYDRIHLRTTYYNYAKHLEANGELAEAIPK